MTIDDVKKICVVGSGLMGRQIALNSAIHGYECWLTDNSNQALEQALQWVDEYVTGRIKKGKITETEAVEILSRFHGTVDLGQGAEGANLIIEAIVEKEDAKRALFEGLRQHVGKDTIIASNSSYMSSSQFVDCVEYPDRLANLHYFNPALVMKLTEVAKGEHTSQETVQVLMEFSRRTGKTPALICKENEGFIVNFILKKTNMAALELVEKGIASFEDVDIAVENGLNYPMGPFRLMDLTGIDLSYYQFCAFESRGETCPGMALLKEKYEAGEIGEKSGKGWYAY